MYLWTYENLDQMCAATQFDQSVRLVLCRLTELRLPQEYRKEYDKILQTRSQLCFRWAHM